MPASMYSMHSAWDAESSIMMTWLINFGFSYCMLVWIFSCAQLKMQMKRHSLLLKVLCLFSNIRFCWICTVWQFPSLESYKLLPNNRTENFDSCSFLRIGNLARSTIMRLLHASCPSRPSRWLSICHNMVIFIPTSRIWICSVAFEIRAQSCFSRLLTKHGLKSDKQLNDYMRFRDELSMGSEEWGGSPVQFHPRITYGIIEIFSFSTLLESEGPKLCPLESWTRICAVTEREIYFLSLCQTLNDYKIDLDII